MATFTPHFGTDKTLGAEPDPCFGADEAGELLPLLIRRLAVLLREYDYSGRANDMSALALMIEAAPATPVDEMTVARELVAAHSALDRIGETGITATDLVLKAAACWGDRVSELLSLDGGKYFGPQTDMKWLLLMWKTK